MKHAPRNVALLNAGIITLVFVAVYLGMVYFGNSFQLVSLAVGSVLIFAASYITLYYSLNRFIYNRLKVIYKTIGKWNEVKQGQHADKHSEDILSMVNQVVLEWHDEQQQKIDELQKMADYRREFLGNVSHELKTPIFNIQGGIHSHPARWRLE